jgi:hypothetical protein
MSESTLEFLATFSSITEAISAAYEETIAYWAPNIPPMTIVYGELGDCVADEFDDWDKALRDRVFSEIEAAMRNGDQDLRTVVATGLIEGLVGRAKRRGNWEKFVLTSAICLESMRILGDKSRLVTLKSGVVARLGRPL